MSIFTAEKKTCLQPGTKNVFVSLANFPVHDKCAGVEFLYNVLQLY